MSNSITAGPIAERLCEQTDDDDNPLKQQAKKTGSSNQPHLRIVYSADRLQEPPWIPMSPQDRPPPSPAAPARAMVGHQPKPMLDRTVQAQIGRMLRDHFSGVAGESVPDRFVTLLAELDQKEKSR